jgi:enoyl-CoA hydratase/carnithine racemase
VRSQLIGEDVPEAANATIEFEKGGITCGQSGSVATVTMNRPELRNAMRPSMWAAMAQCR